MHLFGHNEICTPQVLHKIAYRCTVQHLELLHENDLGKQHKVLSNEIFWFEVGHFVLKFVSIFRILRINLGLCLGYVQIRHVPEVLLGQEKIQIFNSGRHESQKTEECPKMD